MFDTEWMAVLGAFDPVDLDDFFEPDEPVEAPAGPQPVPAPPTLAEIAEKIRPTVLAVEQTLAVPDALRDLFPLGGIARGSRVSLRGSGATSLCLSMLADASRQGSWIAVVGVGALSWGAAAKAGWSLSRCVVVDEPVDSQWGPVMAALVDAIDIVVVDPQRQVSSAEARRLAARSRERGSVIVDLALSDPARPQARHRSRWPVEADLTLTAHIERWSGLGVGHGVLGERRLVIEGGGRRGAHRERRTLLDLASDGTLQRCAAEGGERHLRSVG